MRTGALEISRQTGEDNLFNCKQQMAIGRELRHDWGFPAPWVSQALAGLDALSDAGMPETTPLTLADATTNRSSRWYWVWNEDLTMMMGRPDPYAVVTNEWDSTTAGYTACDKPATFWLKDKADGLNFQTVTGHPIFTVFQMTLAGWRGFLNEKLCRWELNSRRQELASYQNYATQYQNSINQHEKTLEAAKETLANLDDPDWVEEAMASWLEGLRSQNERAIEQAQKSLEAAQRYLENNQPAVEEAQQAVEEAFEAWQESQRV
jgi:Skp family chaperone for outer membrane proteins